MAQIMARYAIHSTLKYTILHGECLCDDNWQIHDGIIICDCAAVCNSAVSLLLGSYPPSFLLLAILQGDVDHIVWLLDKRWALCLLNSNKQ